MTIEFDLDIEDWLAFQEFHLSNNKKLKQWKVISMLAVPLASAIIILTNKWFDTTFMIVLVIVSIAHVLYVHKTFTSRYLKRAKKMLKDNTGIIGRQTFQFTEEFILMSKLNTETKTNWNGINEILENENYYFLFVSSISAFIIPKRKIENDLEALDKIFNQKNLERLEKKVYSNN